MKHTIRVYHEDTDFLGVVYYANYFKYIERARSEPIRDYNLKFNFTVANVCADFKSPARFDDILTVTTNLDYIKGASVGLNQVITRDKDLIFLAIVKCAYVVDEKPTRIPQEVKDTLKDLFK
ncbi:MAG: thioesterase [Verrucomicrobiales bacterium]|nr:thioesterase [Verrucomicrobiales bacterium]